MIKYMKEKNKKLLNEWKEWFLFKSIPIIIVHPLNPNLNIKNIISYIEGYIKNINYIKGIEGIYVGNFDILKQRRIQSLYNDGVIYVSNFQDDNTIIDEKVSKDIVHEIGHSIEKLYELDIYGDKEIEKEFIGKRKRLYDLIYDKNISMSREKFLTILDYDLAIDTFLYQEVGYNKLRQVINGLFLSPYCITSISEYFGNAFEEYLTGDKKYVERICPMVYSRLLYIDNIMRKT